MGALDTPRTNLGDATYLTEAPDFADISQEASFQSPGKDGNLLQQLRNGRSNGISLRTPKRDPLTDRNNLPPSVGGAEFTPLLKSATRNSVRRRGKENGTVSFNTPALDRIDEGDITSLPHMDASMYSSSKNQSILERSLPRFDTSSAASTPLALPRRNGADKGPLHDGNQLSLREQENVIDKIEKENFGLKLKIHFLEDALRKAGPGYSEAALKENTELKVEQVTMQREMHRYKKHLVVAERDLESCRQQITELQENAKHAYADEGLRNEIDQLRHKLQEREADIDEFRQKLSESQSDHDEVEKLRDNIEELELDVREKDRQLTEREDELEELKEKLEEAENNVKDSERDDTAQNHELEDAKETIQDLELNIRQLEQQMDELKEQSDEATADKERAERNLEELQEEMSDKSVVTKGLSRQLDEKVTRLQEELDKSERDYADLERELTEVNHENEDLRSTIDELQQAKQSHGANSTQLQELEEELRNVTDEKDTMQVRSDSLTADLAVLQEETERLERQVENLEGEVTKERDYAVEVEKDLRNQYQDEIERLNDEVSDLQAEVRERDNLYDNDSEKWETEKQTLEAERHRAEERASGLQRTIDRLRETEGSLSDKESKLQIAMQSEADRHRSEEAVLMTQVTDLQDALETRQTLLTNLRNDLSNVRDELRQAQIDYQSQANKVVALEEEMASQRAKSGNALAGRSEGETLRKECESLREQLAALRQKNESGRLAGSDTSFAGQRSILASPARTKWQLTDATTRLEKVTSEKKSLQDELATLRSHLRNSQASLAEVKAERDELTATVSRAKSLDSDSMRVDQERLDLRTAKLKLDNEVRRLKDENRTLGNQRQAAEKALEDEIEKAAVEEERLGQEVLQLQSKLRQGNSAEANDGASARRTIRDLEHQLEDYKSQLAAAQLSGDVDGSSEVSIIRRDLSTARQKELDFLQRESANKDLVKNLRREIADLESKLHDHQVYRLAEPSHASPAKPNTHPTQLLEELQEQLNDVEDQKLLLEEFLEEARQEAEEAAAQHESALQQLQHKLQKAERERDAVTSAEKTSTKDKHSRHLRKTQAEIENLEHDIVQQQQLIEGLTVSEETLRRKLERARSERAAYRMDSEKLQREIQRLKAGVEHRRLAVATGEAEHALETVVRAADSAQDRHKKELRGMIMQMEWMQARWEREAALRSDAAFAKNFVQLQLNVADAWYVFVPPPTILHLLTLNLNSNKAQLRELEHIRSKLLHSKKPLPTSTSSFSSSSHGSGMKPTLRTFFVMARFIARMKISAKSWAKQEVVRKKLVTASEEQRRAKRSKRLRVIEA